MNVTYSIDNDKVQLFFRGYLVNPDIEPYKAVEINKYGEDKSFFKTIYSDENGDRYFMYNKKRVYFKDYDRMSYDELMKRVEAGYWVTSDDILATFLNTPIEDIVIEMDVPLYSTISLSLGLAFTSGDTIRTICQPYLDKYKQNEWHYKMGFIPCNPELRKVCAARNYYFMDLAAMIRNGDVKLTTREAWKDNVEAQQAAINRNIFTRLTNRFRKKKTHTVYYL